MLVRAQQDGRSHRYSVGLLLDRLSGKLLVSRTISIFMVIGPIIPLLGIYPVEVTRHVDQDLYTEMLSAAIIVMIEKKWKKSKCPIMWYS